MIAGIDHVAVVELLRAAIKAHKSDKAWGTASGWGKAHGIDSKSIHDALNADAPVTPRLLEALGLRREYRYFPISR